MAMIRQAGEWDAEKVFSIINGNLDDYFSPDVINFFRMQWPTGQFIAEDFLGNPVGAICGSRLDGGRASISLFAVSAGQRGRGIGTQLLEAFRRSVSDHCRHNILCRRKFRRFLRRIVLRI